LRPSSEALLEREWIILRIIYNNNQIMKERGPSKRGQLPLQLHEFLRTQEYACLLLGSNRGTLFLLKAPATDLATLQGSIPIRITHELYSKPTAPVIRSLLRWYDRPDSQILFEAFTNVADPAQRDDYRRLAKQSTLTVLGYDELLRLAVQKRVANPQQREITQITALADKLRELIPQGEYDFDLAKARVMAQHPLRE
jgi:hypothetical protein